MRNIWPWRDWVVRALDQNQPFDQFTIEQLAGDMLPEATDEQRLATAFHRNAPQARGQTYPVEEYRIKGVIDRVNTIGRVCQLTLDWLNVMITSSTRLLSTTTILYFLFSTILSIVVQVMDRVGLP